MASVKLFAKGVGLKEAAEVEAPMVEQLGMLKGMDKARSLDVRSQLVQVSTVTGRLLVDCSTQSLRAL